VVSIWKATGGRLDYLINNTGRGYTMQYLDTDVETGKFMFDVNVWEPMRVTQACAAMLVRARSLVVMVGSTAELIALPFQGV
jgi:1-acylglycerone phosphate reductase